MSFENLIGQTLGQYELRELLGVGGMGAVYRGHQTTLRRDVAVKVISNGLAKQSGYIARFNQEAQTAANLEHAHIVPIYDFGTKQGLSYVAMRLLNGGTLAQRLEQSRNRAQTLPSLGETAQLIRQVTSALDYAHSQGVVHRDIKASNIMFDNQGSAFIVDFGIARLMEATSSLTGTGITMGTPSYMAPEQWRGEGITPAADQYALGVLIYALVTGALPFEAPTPYALMHMHLTKHPEPSHLIRADVPEAVTRVLEQAMAKEPQARFPTLTAFAQAFDAAIVGSSGHPNQFFTFKIHADRSSTVDYISRPIKPSLRPRSNPLIWGIGISILILLGLVLFLLTTRSSGSDLELRQTQVALSITESALPSGSLITSTSAVIVVLPSPTATLEPSRTFTVTPTNTDIPSTTPTPTTEVTFTSMPSSTHTAIPSPTPTNTITPSAIFTKTPSSTNTPTLSATPTVTDTSTLIPSATPIPASNFEAVTQNADWTPIVKTFNNVEMVLVPPGCFQMGDTTEGNGGLQCFDKPFWISRTEVSNEQYNNCTAVGACTASGRPESGAQMPAVFLNWDQALTFAQWFGGRLPTEAEWEYAARGPDDLIYSWGNDYDVTKVVAGSIGEEPVSSRLSGASWVGALNMSGNVWEWTSSILRDYPYDAKDGREDLTDLNGKRVLRGGSAADGANTVRSANRFGHAIKSPYLEKGIRLARDFSPTDITGITVQATTPVITLLPAAIPIGTPTQTLLPTVTTNPTLITFTPSPTLILTSGQPMNAFITISSSSVNLRSGPGTVYSVAGTATKGEQLTVIATNGKNNDLWYLVNNKNGKSVWVSARIVEIANDNGQIQVAATIPVPPEIVVQPSSQSNSPSSSPQLLYTFTGSLGVDLNNYSGWHTIVPPRAGRIRAECTGNPLTPMVAIEAYSKKTRIFLNDMTFPEADVDPVNYVIGLQIQSPSTNPTNYSLDRVAVTYECRVYWLG